MGIEIEKKFTVKELPKDLDKYPYRVIEQAYLNVTPAIRVRKDNDSYYMTYKSHTLPGNKEAEDMGVSSFAGQEAADQMTIGQTEYNMPLDEATYLHLKSKADGNVITKRRYLIPEKNGLTIELDVFEGVFKGRILAEVEFPTEEAARAYVPAPWFDQDVTGDPKYSNSQMSAEKI